jgi:hypothetical protein
MPKKRKIFREIGAKLIAEGRRDDWLRALDGKIAIGRIWKIRRMARQHPDTRFTALDRSWSFRGKDEAAALIESIKERSQADMDYYGELMKQEAEQ